MTPDTLPAYFNFQTGSAPQAQATPDTLPANFNFGASSQPVQTPNPNPQISTSVTPSPGNPHGLPSIGIVPDIINKVGNDYAQAIPNFLKAASSSKSSNPLVAVGEGALRATASGIGTIFAPITDTISTLADSLSNNKSIQDFLASDKSMGSPFGKVLDAVGSAHNAIQDFQTNHPELAQDLNSAITVGTTAIGAKGEPGINTGIETGLKATGEAITKAPEALANTVKPITDYIVGGANKLSDSLQESSLKLTPTQKVNLGSKLTDIKNYLSDNNITGNPEARYEAIDTKYSQAESKLQTYLADPTNTTPIPKASLLSELDSIKNDYKFDRDSTAINRQIDEAKNTIQTNFPDQIPAKDLNIFKRSTYSGAYNKAGNKVLDTVEHDIGDKVKTAIENSEVPGKQIDGKSIGDFNKEYGTIINARKILKAAQGKSQIGLMGNITARIIGGLVGGAVGGGVPGEIAGTLIAKPVAETIAGTAAKSKVASLLRKK